ncbi:hypothetical protein TSMEX_009995 [Taenia solium]|eukprot:TsM_000648000 transcript=TsM_000648000 gene=TsM_000648000
MAQIPIHTTILITDMAGSRGGQGQFMSLSGLSDPQAAAAAAMKFHLAMTSSASRTGAGTTVATGADTFDHPTSHHRLPPPPPSGQFAPPEASFLPEFVLPSTSRKVGVDTVQLQHRPPFTSMARARYLWMQSQCLLSHHERRSHLVGDLSPS